MRRGAAGKTPRGRYVDELGERVREAQPGGAAAAASLRGWLEETSPHMRWDWPHLVLIQRALERVTRGELKRLMIFVPPRHGKSELVTIRYPVFRMARDPQLKVIVAAHSQELADMFSRESLGLAEGRLPLSKKRRAVNDWRTTEGGGMRAVGVGAGLAGHGASLILIDDPVPGHEEVQAEKFRNKQHNWFRNDLRTRAEPGTPIILIQTRWHEDDLAGRILRSKSGPEWEVLRLPAIAETREERDAWARKHNRPEGEPDPLRRAPGEPLCPDRFTLEELLTMQQQELTLLEFASLYQQTPYGTGGGMFERPWFGIVDEAPQVRCVRFWDCASKVGEHNSYTAGALLGQISRGDWYLKHMIRGRWEYPDAKRVILQTAQMDGSNTPIGIEDTSNGTALLQDLGRDPAGYPYTFQAVKVKADKRTRAGLWASRAQNGAFHLVKGGWNEAFLDEAEAFPHACSHDDQIDAVSGAYEMTVAYGGLLAEITPEELLAMRRLGPVPGVIFKPPKVF